MTSKTRKRARKVYPKIRLGSQTASEIFAAYNFTPAEIRRAEALVRKVEERRRKIEKNRTASTKPRTATR